MKTQLYIQRYIRSAGEEHAISYIANQLGIDVRTSEDGRILFKYNQIKSPMHNRIVQECRGLILDRYNEYAIVSMPFTKFFNYGEHYAHKVRMDTARILEKVDGCLDGDTILQTEDGEKTIREICETKYDGKVMSFDIEFDEIIFDNILNYSITDDNKEWYEIEIEDGEIIKLTGNHRIWLPELNCYRRVDELEGTEKIFLEKVN